ncbi:hypothetical protein IWX78_000109 [Mycetocola sp. CAN_C7]|uniref:hypothetical protein n=1 Tax=Mycetocola sp. CAN_C7 TaxID=2787724 RepID=UPI0018CB235C
MRPTVVVACLAMAVAVAGCTPTAPTPSPGSGSSESATPSATATPTPTVEPLTIVECETLLPIAQARALFSDATEFLGERSPTESSGWFPVAEIDSTLAAASQARACAWGVPNSDGVFTIHAVEVTATQRADLESALVGAGFSSVTTGTVTGYEMTGENEVSTTAATHLFTGAVWIMSNATALTTTGPAAASALDALRAANPTLGL